jgi:hypothetical protein
MLNNYFPSFAMFLHVKKAQQASNAIKPLCHIVFKLFIPFYVGISDNITRAAAMAAERIFLCGMGSGIEKETRE